MSGGSGLCGAPAGTKYVVVPCRVDDLFQPSGETPVHLKGYIQCSNSPLAAWRKWLPPPEFAWRTVSGGLYTDREFQSDVMAQATLADQHATVSQVNAWTKLLSEGTFGLNIVGRAETA